MKTGIAIWLIKEWNKTAEKVYKRLYTKLNASCLLGSLSVPVRGMLTIPPWDTKLNSSGGIRSSSDQDTSPRPPYKYHPVTRNSAKSVVITDRGCDGTYIVFCIVKKLNNS